MMKRRRQFIKSLKCFKKNQKQVLLPENEEGILVEQYLDWPWKYQVEMKAFLIAEEPKNEEIFVCFFNQFQGRVVGIRNENNYGRNSV